MDRTRGHVQDMSRTLPTKLTKGSRRSSLAVNGRYGAVSVSNSNGSVSIARESCGVVSPRGSLVASTCLGGDVLWLQVGSWISRRMMCRVYCLQILWMVVAALLLFLRTALRLLLRRSGLFRCGEGMVDGSGTSVVLGVMLIRLDMKLFQS